MAHRLWGVECSIQPDKKRFEKKAMFCNAIAFFLMVSCRRWKSAFTYCRFIFCSYAFIHAWKRIALMNRSTTSPRSTKKVRAGAIIQNRKLVPRFVWKVAACLISFSMMLFFLPGTSTILTAKSQIFISPSDTFLSLLSVSGNLQEFKLNKVLIFSILVQLKLSVNYAISIDPRVYIFCYH